MENASFYADAANILSDCHASREDLAAILDPQTGFASRLSQMCKKRLKGALEPEYGVDFSQEDIDMLRLECSTWDLLQTLMSLRKTEPPTLPSARELLKENPYTPTATLAQSIMVHSPLLNELVVVREWLHDDAPPPRLPEATTGYWNFTKHRLLQGLRTGNKKEIETLVSELDPDVVNRDQGKSLAGDDANYEKSLSQSLYSYVRAGKLGEAIDLCQKTHRSWRAASIRGALLFQWRALSTVKEPTEERTTEDFVEGWSGNKRRKLWKATCTRAALNTSLSESERALYASLAPSPSTFVALKTACRTWEDHLWAQISIICEGKQVDELARACGGGSYWESGIDAFSRIRGTSLAAAEQEQEKEEQEWEREVVGTLETLAKIGVVDGPPAMDPFHVSQLHIILGRTDKLLSDFATGLQNGEFNPEQSNYQTLTRFFAHLCLFLQMIDIPVPVNATQVILEVYLQVLEDAGQREHIAMYASALGENAVERYALFLTSLDTTTTREERRETLRRAEQHNLDMIRVAQVTAERSVEKALEALPRMTVALPSVLSRESPLSDWEWYLIRSIEWTTFMEETFNEALEQANATFRYFLGNGKVYAAKTLLSMLPEPLRGTKDTSGHSAEFLHYVQFFTIWDLLDRVAESQSLESTYTTKGAKATWLNSFKGLLDDAREKILALLTHDWLIDEQEIGENEPDQRQSTLLRIRYIFIPELVIRLHALLVNTGDKIEGNFKHALHLVNVLADNRYHLFDDFLSDGNQRLGDYLTAVRLAVLKSVESGGSDPFKSLSVA